MNHRAAIDSNWIKSSTMQPIAIFVVMVMVMAVVLWPKIHSLKKHPVPTALPGYESVTLVTGNASDWQTKWSLSNSVLLTLTTLTTIGYGHISPRYTEFMGLPSNFKTSNKRPQHKLSVRFVEALYMRFSNSPEGYFRSK